jgi:hypothetical protein
MSVRSYVDSNFSAQEKAFFDFVLGSFPEEILVNDEGEESEITLFLLASLSKVLGSGKEAINNLVTAHSAKSLYDNIRDGYFQEGSRQLLLPLADDLGYPRLYGTNSLEEMLDMLVDEEPFVENSYRFIRNRGSYSGVYQVLNSFLSYIGDREFDSIVIEEDRKTVILLGFLSEFIDYTNCTSYAVGGETYQVCRPLEGTVLYDMFMSIKPAGIKYDVFIKYMVYAIYNLISDRVIRDGSMVGGDGYAVETASLDAPVFSSVILDTVNDTYVVEVENTSDIFSVKLWLSDWSTNSGTDPINEDFTTGEGSWDWSETTEIAEGTEATVVPRYSDLSTPDAVGQYAIVTGYKWEKTNQADYLSCPNKIVISTMTDPESQYEMSYTKFPQYSLYISNSGNVVVKASDGGSVTVYWRLVRVDTSRTGNDYYESEFTGESGFSYDTYTFLPGQTKIVTRQSTDTGFNALSYIAGYFTTLDNGNMSTITIEQDTGILNGTVDESIEVSGESDGNVTQLEKEDISGTLSILGNEDSSVSGVDEGTPDGTIGISSLASGYATSSPTKFIDDDVEVSGDASGIATDSIQVAIDTLGVSGESAGEITQMEEEDTTSSISATGVSYGYVTGLGETFIDDSLDVSGSADGSQTQNSELSSTFELDGSSAGYDNQIEEDDVDNDIVIAGASSGYNE